MPTTPVKKMGFEGKLYYGTGGAQASTEVTNCRDVQYDNDLETADTTTRGSGSPPIETGRPVRRTVSLSWTMLMKSDDTTLTALLAAARNGTVIALRVLPYSGGAGLDADAYIGCANGQPINGEQTVVFTLKKLEDADRAPILNA